MTFKIPSGIIENFMFSNFQEAKETSSGEIHINSPFEKDGKLRFYVNPEKGRFFNQKTQIGGSFSSFAAEYLNIPYVEVASLLIREYSNRADKEEIDLKEVIEVKKELEFPKGLVFFDNKPDGVIRNRAAKYFKNRGISTDGLGYIYKNGSEFNKRVFIPFYEEGIMVYFIARAFDKSKLRYKNPPDVSASEVVYNIDNIDDEVFIFEGVFDAMSLDTQIGTCMLSNSLKKAQAVKILDKMPSKITFVLDNDKEQKVRDIINASLKKNIELLMLYKPPSLDLKIYTYRPPERYKDFNEYSVDTGVHDINYEDCKLYKHKDFSSITDKISWGK